MTAMETPASVHVGWALWGKQPGSSNDYSVLASSAEPLSQPEFASVLAHFAPGTPPTERDQPSSLPWVIISRVGVEGKSYVGMAIQRPSDDVDSVGRPITMTSYFCVPFDELTDPPVSYAALYHQLASVRLPQADTSLISLSLPRLDPAAIATEVTKENWEPSVTAAAAMLLDGPVSIVGSEGSTVDERLRFLDAVAAMLPFGYREDFTAATWSDAGARHPIRLAFAARAREDAGVVQWRSPSAGPGRNGPGGTYFRLLSDVRGRGGGTGGDQLAALIGALAGGGAQADFGHPQTAIDTLHAFDLPFIVVVAVLDGTAQPADVRAVFGQGRITELGPMERQTMLGALIDLAEPQDLPEIRKWWELALGGDNAVVLPNLVRACRRLLWTPTPSLAVGEYLTLAASYGMLDAVLAGVLAVPASETELNGGVSMAARLFAERALSDPQPDLPLTKQRVASDPLVFAELLAEYARSEREARAALGWLEPGLHEFLRPFSLIVGNDPGAVDQRQLGQLARHGIDPVGALVRAASRCGRLGLVLPAFVSWLALGRNPADPAADRYWCEQARALTVMEDPQSQAWIDLALFASANDPRFLLVTVSGRPAAPYCEFLAASWSQLVADTGQAVDDLVTDGLIGYLNRAPWTSDPSQVETVVAIGSMLTAGGQRKRLESAITDALLDAPEAGRLDAARNWLHRALPDHDPGRSGDVLAMLRRPHSGLGDRELAELCARAFSEGLDPEDVCHALAESRAIGSGQAALKLLDRLRTRVYAMPAGPQDPHEWLMTLAAFFADGTLGEHIPEEFRQAAVRVAYRDFVYRLDILYTAVTKGNPNSQPELSNDEIKHLEWIPKSVDQILRDAKKRPGLGSMLRGVRRDRDEADDRPGNRPGTEPQTS
jgi:hypothetical protein